MTIHFVILHLCRKYTCYIFNSYYCSIKMQSGIDACKQKLSFLNNFTLVCIATITHKSDQKIDSNINIFFSFRRMWLHGRLSSVYWEKRIFLLLPRIPPGTLFRRSTIHKGGEILEGIFTSKRLTKLLSLNFSYRSVNFKMSLWCLQISQKNSEIFVRISALAS